MAPWLVSLLMCYGFFDNGMFYMTQGLLVLDGIHLSQRGERGSLLRSLRGFKLDLKVNIIRLACDKLWVDTP